MSKIFTSSMLAFMILGLGCGGSQKPPVDTSITDEAPQCADAAINLRAQVTALGTQTGVDNTEAAMVTHDLVNERCAADGWSPAAIACVAIATAGDMHTCADQLTPAQHEAFRGALEAQPAAGAALMQLMQHPAPPTESAAPGGGAPPTDPCGGAE